MLDYQPVVALLLGIQALSKRACYVDTMTKAETTFLVLLFSLKLSRSCAMPMDCESSLSVFDILFQRVDMLNSRAYISFVHKNVSSLAYIGDNLLWFLVSGV